MRTLLRSLLILATAACLPPVAHAQVPALLEVPAALTGAVRAELTLKRADLLGRLSALRYQAKAYNENYGGQNFPENDPRAREGQTEKARLDQARNAYVRDANAFNDLIHAVMAGCGIGRFSGGFYVVLPDGRSLTGQDAASTPLSPGTQVITSGNGHVQLFLADGTALGLGPNSNFVLDKDPNAVPEGLIARLKQGVLDLVTGESKLTREISIALPNAVVSVRGTDVEVDVESTGAGYIRLNSGNLEITEQPAGRTFTMTGGQRVTFDANGSFSVPAPLRAVKLSRPGWVGAVPSIERQRSQL